MEFILLVEGKTEKVVLPHFIGRWLEPRLSKPVGIKTVAFHGGADLIKNSPTEAKFYLSQNSVIAVISLLDLYGLNLNYPNSKKTIAQRYVWAKEHLEIKVGLDMFFQFFAVHETEAWLLSDPSIFPASVEPIIRKISNSPESINSAEPPGKRLIEIFRKQTKKRYKKVLNGTFLFEKLDPNIAYHKCPHLKELLDKMLELAQKALTP